VSDKNSKWDGQFTAKISVETLKFEIEQTMGDIETMADIMIAIGVPEVETYPHWWRFFAHQLEHLTEASRLSVAARIRV
jgi:hypothetical protein